MCGSVCNAALIAMLCNLANFALDCSTLIATDVGFAADVFNLLRVSGQRSVILRNSSDGMHAACLTSCFQTGNTKKMMAPVLGAWRELAHINFQRGRHRESVVPSSHSSNNTRQLVNMKSASNGSAATWPVENVTLQTLILLISRYARTQRQRAAHHTSQSAMVQGLI
jgi:hypothetical protein